MGANLGVLACLIHLNVSTAIRGCVQMAINMDVIKQLGSSSIPLMVLLALQAQLVQLVQRGN